MSHVLLVLCSGISIDAWCEARLKAMAAHFVDDRPDRFVHRVVRRHPKPDRYMTKPRQVFEQLAA
jgi:hypothetical protein